MRNGSCKLDVAHSLAANLAASNLNSASFADFALKTNSLVFSAVALPVFLRAENSLAEKTVFLGLLAAVVYSFGARNLAVRPRSNLLGGSKSYFHRLEYTKTHYIPLYLIRSLTRL